MAAVTVVPTVVNTFLTIVVEKIFLFLKLSAVTLKMIDVTHMARYGIADKSPFCNRN